LAHVSVQPQRRQRGQRQSGLNSQRLRHRARSCGRSPCGWSMRSSLNERGCAALSLSLICMQCSMQYGHPPPSAVWPSLRERSRADALATLLRPTHPVPYGVHRMSAMPCVELQHILTFCRTMRHSCNHWPSLTRLRSPSQVTLLPPGPAGAFTDRGPRPLDIPRCA
jgi:hypothetical protein